MNWIHDILLIPIAGYCSEDGNYSNSIFQGKNRQDT